MTEPPASQQQTKNSAIQAHMDVLLAEPRLRCQELKSQPAPTDGVYCKAEWDGLVCFNHTRAGSNASVHCPDFPVYNPEENVRRYCEPNGTWQVDGAGRTISDFSDCIKNRSSPNLSAPDEAFSYIYLFMAGASVSLVLLIISLVIFYGFRQLRCDRVTVHKNLFISFACTALTWILFYSLVVLDGHVVLENPLWCRYLHVLAQYFTTTNFSWMCCEALYLHIIMAHTLHTGKKLIKCLVVAGWGVPLLLTGIYAAARATVSGSYKKCWIEETAVQWILAGPILVSVVVNICILINLVRLLMTKLRQVPDAQQSRKAAKATLILVPLFGLQFLVFPVRPAEDSPMHDVYLHFMAVLMSMQGTLVSIIFCFCNGEVRSLIMRKWHQHRLMTSRSSRKNTGFTSSTYVDGYSVVDTTRDATKVMPDNATLVASIRNSNGGSSIHSKVCTNTETMEMKPTNSPSSTTPLVEKSPGPKSGPATPVNDIE
ncbi:hypothetical protein EGW08_011508 [Elysia chlorotica]|uniref:G-protein coupled receptors family 2 profile 2 domain-containing protein n=1 Tax=Elysia chlorotica TaxID=188477 RepID=A0A3S0ZQZ1_ELYCH|nr:hypothetical protein EGW08_011508 [Elysia chlorotica]